MRSAGLQTEPELLLLVTGDLKHLHHAERLQQYTVQPLDRLRGALQLRRHLRAERSRPPGARCRVDIEPRSHRWPCGLGLQLRPVRGEQCASTRKTASASSQAQPLSSTDTSISPSDISAVMVRASLSREFAPGPNIGPQVPVRRDPNRRFAPPVRRACRGNRAGR